MAEGRLCVCGSSLFLKVPIEDLHGVDMCRHVQISVDWSYLELLDPTASDLWKAHFGAGYRLMCARKDSQAWNTWNMEKL